jgi:hypothetical protein
VNKAPQKTLRDTVINNVMHDPVAKVRGPNFAVFWARYHKADRPADAVAAAV